MAINIPNNLYTAGAVSLDASPSVNMYAQIQARRQAQEQAKQATFDEYLRNLNTKVNAAGKRTIDNPAFQDMYNKWQQFGLQNRDKIMKNDINTRTQFDRGYQELLNFVNESKTEEEKKKPLVEILLDPNKRSKLSTNVFNSIQSHDEPLYVKDKEGNYVRNENRKSIDYTSNLFDPQFDLSKGFEGWAKGMKMGKGDFEIKQRDPVTGQVIRAYTEKYDPDQVKQISLNAARSVKDNPEYGNYYQQRFENLKDDEYKQLNEAFQRYYGKYINIPGGQKLSNYIDSPEEVAAADAIIQAEALTKKGEESVSDYDKKFQDSIAKMAYNSTLIAGRSNNRESDNDLSKYDVLGRYEPKYVTKNIKIKNQDGWGTVLKEATVIPENEVDVLDKKLLGDVDAIKGDDGSKYYIVREDGDWEGNRGQVISKANVARANLDKTNINEEKRGRLSEDIAPNSKIKPSSTYTINGQKYTKSQLLQGGWTEDQIEKAIQAGKLK